MNQDAFRKLLSTSHGPSTPKSTIPRGSLLTARGNTAQSNPEEGAAKAEFKPRKIRKQNDAYRDRAAERREGRAGDFAQVEAVLETFERQNADNEDKKAVEEQRRYLGGDSEHSVLVKGLDIALLEQQKAKALGGSNDDDSLEKAYLEASSNPSTTTNGASRKRTREDIIRDLKEKRAKSSGDDVESAQGSTGVPKGSIEEGKKAGKFRPIGFKPIDSSSTTKKEKGEKDGVKKKRRKVRGDSAGGKTAGVKEQLSTTQSQSAPTTMPPGPSIAGPSKPPVNPSDKEPIVDENVDIFADAGEYEGINFDDDVDELDVAREAEPPTAPVPSGKWFADEEPPPTHTATPPPDKGKTKSKASALDDSKSERDGEDEQEPEQPLRLQPLASSALPSIRDVLEADSYLEAEQKRRARKEKRKGKEKGDDGEGKRSEEAKLNRDYQKLKAYEKKKGGGVAGQ